jgi:DNA-binding transcriptional ArsR family regulator
MSSIFPLRDTVTPDKSREPRLVDLDEETADEVFEALSSQTTRKIFLELHHSPQTTSDLAEATDTSVQNVQYHLEKLTDADLVEVVDTWYSERGTEMKVYAPEDESLVLFAGRDKQRTLRNLLDRVVGVLGVLVPGSILAGLGAQWIPTNSGGANGGEAAGGANGAESGGGANGDELGDVGENGAESNPDSIGNGGESNGDLNIQGEDNVPGSESAQNADAVDPDGMNGDLGVNDSVDSINVEYTTENAGNFTADRAELFIDNGTVDTVRISSTSSGVTENGTAADNFTVTGVDVTYELNETAQDSMQSAPAPNGSGGGTVAPDNGTASDLGSEMVNNSTEAADAAASIDPTLAAAVGFFVGGLLIFAALTEWYGNW